MKRFWLVAMLAVLPMLPLLAEGAKSSGDAKESVGYGKRTVTITGEVLEVRRSSKGNIFLYLDDRYPHQRWAILISARNAAAFSGNTRLSPYGCQDAQGYNAKTIEVRGETGVYEGQPVIEIASPSQISILSK